MSQEQPAEPADAGVDGPDNPSAVVQWGDDDDAPPRGRLTRVLAGLRADPRLAPLMAGFAALTLFASLVTEWRVWAVADPENPAQEPIVSGVVSFPSVGTAYLLGLFMLAACVTLALSGSGQVRHNARLVGLAVTGVLVAVLVTATAQLDKISGLLDDIALRPSNMTTDVTYGRGIYLAYAGVAAATLALLLAVPARRGQAATSGPDSTGDPDDDELDGDTESSSWAPRDDADDWPWRPRASAPSRPPGGPDDLTVEPASPFLPPTDPDGSR